MHININMGNINIEHRAYASKLSKSHLLLYSLFMIFQKHAGVLFFPCLSGEDVWSYAKKLPHLFQQGGVFYNIVKKDMGKSTSVFKKKYLLIFLIKKSFSLH